MRRSQEYRYLNEQRRPLWQHLLWAVVLAVVFWFIGDRLLAPYLHQTGSTASKAVKPSHDIDVVIREIPKPSKPLTPRPRPKPPTQTASDRQADQVTSEPAPASGSVHERPAAAPKPTVAPPAKPTPAKPTPAKPTPAKPQAAPARPVTERPKPATVSPQEPSAPKRHTQPKSAGTTSRPAPHTDTRPSTAASPRSDAPKPASKPAPPKPAQPQPAQPKPTQTKPPAVQPSDSLDELSHHPNSTGSLRIRLAARYATQASAEQAAMRLRPVAPSAAVVADDTRPGSYRVQLAAYAQRDNARQFVVALARSGVADALSIE